MFLIPDVDTRPPNGANWDEGAANGRVVVVVLGDREVEPEGGVPYGKLDASGKGSADICGSNWGEHMRSI